LALSPASYASSISTCSKRSIVCMDPRPFHHPRNQRDRLDRSFPSQLGPASETLHLTKQPTSACPAVSQSQIADYLAYASAYGQSAQKCGTTPKRSLRHTASWSRAPLPRTQFACTAAASKNRNSQVSS